MNQDVINVVVYFYGFVCIGLLVFNLLYMLRTKKKEGRQAQRVERMAALQRQRIEQEDMGKEAAAAYCRKLARRLGRVSQLSAFHAALEKNREKYGQAAVERYLSACSPAILPAAMAYKKRTAMEQAYMAYFAAQNLGNLGETYRRLNEIFFLYLEHSTVYSRENILQALYALGDAKSVARTLERFELEGWYHHPRLLSDGLLTFQGDQEELARRLWSVSGRWQSMTRVALVQFMTGLSGDFSDLMEEALSDEDEEVSFAAVRYFGRHPDIRVRDRLLEMVRREDDQAIAATLALRAYPDAEVKETLKRALGSRNWYIRKNAAASLLGMGLTREEEEELGHSEDRYAREIFVYTLESARRGKG